MSRLLERGLKLEAAAKAFLDARKRSGKRLRTISNYACDLKYFTDWMKSEGHTHYNDFDRPDVRAFVDWVSNQSTWSEATRNMRLRSLKAFFNWVDGDEDCTEMGMRGFAKILPQLKKTPLKMWIPTAGEINRFVAGFPREQRAGLRDYTVCMLMLDTGMRVGEVRYLKMEHLKLDEKTILVPKEGKTGFRVVFITDEMVKHLRRWLHKRETFAQCDRVFVTDTGGPMLTGTFNLTFARNRKRLGMTEPGRHITPHTFRHFFATNWIRMGGDIARLRQMTGHATLEILNGYLHLAGDLSVGEANEKVSAMRVVAEAGAKRGGRQRTAIAL